MIEVRPTFLNAHRKIERKPKRHPNRHPVMLGARESGGPYKPMRDRASESHRTARTGIRWSPQHSESGLPRTPPARKRRSECPTLTPALPVHHAPVRGGRRGREAERGEITPPMSTRLVRESLKRVVSPCGLPTMSGPAEPARTNAKPTDPTEEVRGTGPDSGMSAAEFPGSSPGVGTQ